MSFLVMAMGPWGRDAKVSIKKASAWPVPVKEEK